MHQLYIPEEIDEPIPISAGQWLNPGETYICPNAFVGQLFLSVWRVKYKGETWPMRALVKATPWPGHSFDPNRDWNREHIWLYRGGGIGDVLMMTPLVRELKKRWPRCVIHMACGSSFHDLFYGLDVITEFIPITVKSLDDTLGNLVSFEEAIEGDPKAEKMHMAQVFASHCGITLDDIKPSYKIKTEEKEWAQQKYPRTKKKRIAVQFLASALYRSYPKMERVISELAKKAEVFLFGLPGQVKLERPIPGITNLMDEKISLRESIAILSDCDKCICPDSAFVHVCSALDIPCIALYGPFPSELRISSEKALAFNGKAPCAPCFFHATTPVDFPHDKPCTKIRRCVAMENIPFTKVVEAALSP